jgi:hypothetical protein
MISPDSRPTFEAFQIRIRILPFNPGRQNKWQIISVHITGTRYVLYTRGLLQDFLKHFT